MPWSPLEPARNRLKGAKLGHDTVDVIKACPVTAAQIQPGLLSVGFGWQLNLFDGLESDLHYLFSDPSRCRLPESRRPDEIPQPKVVVGSDDERHAVVSLLHQRGVVAATSSILFLGSGDVRCSRALPESTSQESVCRTDVPCFASLWTAGPPMQSRSSFSTISMRWLVPQASCDWLFSRTKSCCTTPRIWSAPSTCSCCLSHGGRTVLLPVPLTGQLLGFPPVLNDTSRRESCPWAPQPFSSIGTAGVCSVDFSLLSLPALLGCPRRPRSVQGAQCLLL